MRVLAGRDRERLAWVALGVAIAAVIVAALRSFLGAFLFAVFLYYATRPLYRRVSNHVSHPDLAVTLTMGVIVLPVLLIVGYAGMMALQELDRFLATHSLASYRSAFQPALSLARGGQLGQLWTLLVAEPGQPIDPAVRRALGPVFGRARTVAGLVFTVLSQTFLMSVFLFYLLRDDKRIARWVGDKIDPGETTLRFFVRVDDDLETVFFGNLAVIGVSAVVATTCYFLLNLFAPGGPVVSIPLLLGLLIGVATLVPIVGMKIVYLPYGAFLAGLAVTTDTPIWHPVLFLAITFVVVDTIPDIYIRAFLSARSGLHMGAILLGYVLGTMAFGWRGLFLGPIVVVFGTHFAQAILPELVGGDTSPG